MISNHADHRREGISLKLNGDKLILALGHHCRDRAWAEGFGLIQEKLATASERHLELDLQETIWVDPNPLLAVAITLEDWRSQGRLLEIKLPDPATSNQPPEVAAFLIFLEREGFLPLFVGLGGGPREVIAEHTTITYGGEPIDSYPTLRSWLFTNTPNLPIPAVPAISARLFNMEHVQSVSALVDELLVEAHNNGLKKHFDRNIYSLPNKQASALSTQELSPSVFSEELRQILIELLENIKEHAYASEDYAGHPHLGAIYARFRYGINDGRAMHVRPALMKLHEDERVHCPRLELATIVAQVGFIEIFLADGGIGLSTHLRHGLHHEGKHTLKVFFNRLATNDPFSRWGNRAERERHHKSPMPGLKHVTDILSRGNGFLRALDKFEWAGAPCPLPHPQPVPGGPIRETKISESINSDQPVRGTHILIRASTGEPQGLPERWGAAVLRSAAAIQSDPLLPAWSDDQEIQKDWNTVEFLVKDDSNLRREGCPPSYRLTIGGRGKVYPCVLWRPDRNLRRNDIRKALQDIGREYPGAHILIADQDIATALMTAWTLEGMALAGVLELKNVSVISNNLAVVDLRRRSTGFREKVTRLTTASSKLLTTSPAKGLSLAQVIAALRHMDGQVFWSAVTRHDRKFNLLLKGRILWPRTGRPDRPPLPPLELDVYLDFPQALNIKACRWACRRALNRFLAYCSPKDSLLAADHLVDPLVNSFLYHNNSDFVKEAAFQERPAVSLGSLLVSMSSLERERQAETAEGESHLLIAHFLQHPRLVARRIEGRAPLSLLPWLEGTGLKTGEARDPERGEALERVTDTPIVGPGGTRYWKVYRALQGRSLYGVAPRLPGGVSVEEAYAFWQSRGLLRLGHWHHGSHHDFVGVDLFSALRIDQLNLRGVVWSFLLKHFQRLAPEYQETDGFPPCHLLVCVANEGTMLITNTVFRELSWLEEKTIFFPFVQRQRSAMRLRVSPIAIESARRHIQELKKAGGEVRVLLLDTHFGSARTFQELSSLLVEIGADDVNTLALLDRSRLPNDTASFARNWHKLHARLWRLDVDALSPSIGPRSAAGCPLCIAVNAVEDIFDDIPAAMKVTHSRLQDWIETGRVRILSKASPLTGLPPVKLPRPIRVSGGHSVDAGEREISVQIFEAGALATVLLEAVTITGVHESVQGVLEFIDRMLPMADPSDAQFALNAKIYVLVSQALLLRHDVDFNRRVLIYRQLLRALFYSPEISPATAFAGLILAGVNNSSIVRSLTPEVLTHLDSPAAKINLDYALAVAIMAKRSRSESLRRHSRVHSLLSLVSGVQDYPPKVLRDVFVILGFRDGQAHETKLHRLLNMDLTRDTLMNLMTILALVEHLVGRLGSLMQAAEWLPHRVDAEKIAGWINRLDRPCQELRRAVAEQDFQDRTSRAWEDLRHALYLGEAETLSIYTQVKESFSYNIGQAGRFVEEILQRKPNAKIQYDEIERIGPRNFDKVDQVRALHLPQIEDCVSELLDNAMSYSTEQYPGSQARIRWSATPSEGDTIILRIWNRCGQEPKRPHPSMNQRILEDLGGQVVSELQHSAGFSEFCIQIKLPTLSDLVRLR